MKKAIGFIICLFLIATVLQIAIMGTESYVDVEKPVFIEFNSIVLDNPEVVIGASKLSKCGLIYDEYEIIVGEHWQLTLTVRWDPTDPQKTIRSWVDTDTLPYGAMFPQGATSPQCVCDYGEVSGILDWTPSEEQVGKYVIVFHAGEECGNSQVTFNVKITVALPEIPWLTVNKWVSADDGLTYEEEVVAYVCSNVRFRIETENSGLTDLSNVVVNDTLPTFLSYADNATPFEPVISGNTLSWSLPGVFKILENITIEFDAHVNDEETGENEAVVTADYTDGHISENDIAVVNGQRRGLIVDVIIETKFGVGITTLITNIGESTIDKLLTCTIIIDAPFMIQGKETVKQTPQPIPPGLSVYVTSDLVLGFGPAEINAKVRFENEIIAEATANGFVFGLFVYVF